ncbi:MAG: hypothetical protein Q9M50_02330 [Methylococcales bacterium]|nr:hypothetical protein [Methylococcales bacterium]
MSFIENRYFYLHEKDTLKGWGVYVLDTQTKSKLGLEVPAPLDEEGAFDAGMNLFKTLNARSLAIAGSNRKAQADLSADALQSRRSFFHYFHHIMSRHNSLQIRTYTDKTARLVAGKRRQEGEIRAKGLESTLWFTSKIPTDLNLPLIKKSLKTWQIEWNTPPFVSLQRDDSAYGFAELMLNKQAVRRLIFSPLLLKEFHVSILEQALSIEGYLQDWILNRKDDIAARGSDLYQTPKQGELLFLDEKVLTPLMQLLQQYQLKGNHWTQNLEDDLEVINKAAAVMNYQLIRYHHKGTQRHYLILQEKSSQRFWGLYVFRLGAHDNYGLQVPRPLFDVNSFEYATALFERLQAQILMVATTHPYANMNGSSDLLHPDNSVSLFNLVNQVALRTAPEQPLLMISSRAFSHKIEHAFIDADVLIAFKQGYEQRRTLNTLKKQLLETLEGDSLKIHLVDGSEESIGYEVGNNAQAKYLNATQHKSFALLWVSLEARNNYSQQNENFWQAAQFNALGIQTRNDDLLSYLQQQKLSSDNKLNNIQGLTARYTNSHDILQLQAIKQQAETQAYTISRLIDISSRQAFLLLHNNQQQLMAVANLFPRNQEIKSLMPRDLNTQLAEFVNQRNFWLQVGQP